jgi:hypothetical protein
MTDLKTKTQCKAVYLHLLAGMSLEAVGAELELPVEDVKKMLMEFRTRVLAYPKYQTSAKTCAKAKNKR